MDQYVQPAFYHSLKISVLKDCHMLNFRTGNFSIQFYLYKTFQDKSLKYKFLITCVCFITKEQSVKRIRPWRNSEEPVVSADHVHKQLWWARVGEEWECDCQSPLPPHALLTTEMASAHEDRLWRRRLLRSGFEIV